MARTSKKTVAKLLAAGCIVGLIGSVAANAPAPEEDDNGVTVGDDAPDGEFIDTDGDGINDSEDDFIDLDGDGVNDDDAEDGGDDDEAPAPEDDDDGEEPEDDGEFIDTDGDGINDSEDDFVDADGDGVADGEADGDDDEAPAPEFIDTDGDGIADGAPVEEPEEPAEEPEEEPEEPEEPPVDAMAPTADAPGGDAELPPGTSPDADAAALEALGYFGEKGSDYVPNKGLATPVANVGDGGLVVETAEECATACEDLPGCNAASYYISDWPGDKNCYLKAINPGCTVPADKLQAPNAWLLMSKTRCDVEVVVAPVPAPAEAPAIAPVAAGPAPAGGAYTRYPGNDYIPAKAGEPPNAVEVTNIEGASMLVDNIAGCEAFCTSTPGCNGASYYAAESNVVKASGKNCFAKTFGDTCTLPSDAATDETATLLLKSCLALAPAATPAGAGGDSFDQPAGGAGAGTTTETGGTPTDRATGTPPAAPAGDVVGTPSAAVNLRSAACALAVAGAAAAFL